MKKNKMMIIIFSCMLMFYSNSHVLAFKNYDSSAKSCGSGLIKNIPEMLPKIISTVYFALQIVVPILLVIFGMIDLIKAITAGKEDEIKKTQGVFIRRLITGALVFFIFAIVKLLIYLAADDQTSGNKIVKCANCFLSQRCD